MSSDRSDSTSPQSDPSRSEELRQRILQHIASPGYQPVKPKVIAKKLDMELERDTVRRAIKRLVREGKLSFGAGHSVRPAGDGEANRITGVFRRTRDGGGYVRPHMLPSERAAGDEPPPDVHIAARYAQDAASGDTVLVKLLSRMRPGKETIEGEVLNIVERDTHQFVGSYLEDATGSYVRIDGTLFSDPISVGDPGAKRPKVEDKVVVEMVRFPSHIHPGEAVLTKVLGARGEPGVDTQMIIHEYGLPGDFPEDVLEESRERAEEFDKTIDNLANTPDRLDLTGETIITIDPATARDFDDAISLIRLENGHWRLGVHIADVSHFVQPGTALDREAKDRSTSVYLPDMVIPMLPEIISNNLASLQPDRVRYCMTAHIEFTPEGTFIAADCHSSAIKSCRRFTYEEVDEFLADRNSWQEKLAPDVHRLLGDMHTLAMTLRKRRFERGALEMTMNDVEIDLDADGRVCGAHFEKNTESHQIIEEFMLAANEAVAQTLEDDDIAFLRRVHPSPDPRKLKLLTDFVAELGFSTASLESRFALQELLSRVEGKPEQHAVNFAVLRSMSRAVYSPEDEGHFALASDCYCHFTSPIRRYPDLITHRQILAKLQNKTPRYHFADLVTLGQHCSDREQRAEKAERDLNKIKLLHYMEDRIGQEIEAIITGVESFGLFAQGLDIPAEGLIHITSLGDDYYHYDRQTHSLIGYRGQNTFRLGDLIRVAVARVDMDRRQLDFRLIKQTGPARKRPQDIPRGKGQAPSRGKPGTGKPAKGASQGKRPQGKPGKKRRRK